MIGPPEPAVKLAHTWRCTRPEPLTSIERSLDAIIRLTRCPQCGAESREEVTR